jgi:hypothetical protein
MRFVQRFAARQEQARRQEKRASPAGSAQTGGGEKETSGGSRGDDRHDDDGGRRDDDGGKRSRLSWRAITAGSQGRYFSFFSPDKRQINNNLARLPSPARPGCGIGRI